MDDVLVRVIHVVTLVGADDALVGHDTELSSKWILISLMEAALLNDSMGTSVVTPLGINILVIAAAKLGEHLWSREVSQTSLVYFGPVNNWNWRSLFRNRWRSWSHKILTVFENMSQFWMDKFDILFPPPSVRLLLGEN